MNFLLGVPGGCEPPDFSVAGAGLTLPRVSLGFGSKAGLNK